MREALGLVLLVTQLLMNVPVIVKLLRSRSGEGVSLSGEMIWVVGGLGWVWYGLFTDSRTLVLSGLLATIGSGVVSVLVLRYSRQSLLVPVALASATAVAIVSGALLGGVQGLSVAMAVFSVVQFLPQLIVTSRALRKGLPGDGVSLAGSSVRSIYTFGWALYAGAWFLWSIPFISIDWPLAVWGLCGALVFGLQGYHAVVTSRRAALTV